LKGQLIIVWNSSRRSGNMDHFYAGVSGHLFAAPVSNVPDVTGDCILNESELVMKADAT
jgi:hypothetical protein